MKKLTALQISAYSRFLKAISCPKFSRPAGHAPKKIPVVTIPPGRETPNYLSLNTGHAPTPNREQPHYTGSRMKGIGTLHKSNAVPVFSDDEVLDISKMRR
jgi:hypothetical protein